MNIRYIGKKPSRADTLYGTGLVWSGHGDVQTCTDPAKAKQLLRHTDMFEPADAPQQAQAQGQQSKVPAQPLLIGTDALPANVDVGGDTSVALADLVRAAHEESGLSIEQWNDLPQVDRDGAIQAVLHRAKALVAARAAQTTQGSAIGENGSVGTNADAGTAGQGGAAGQGDGKGGDGSGDGKPQFVMATTEGPLVLDALDKDTLRKIAKDLGLNVSNNAGEETLRRRLVEAHPVV